MGDLDDASEAQIRALLASVTNSGAGQVTRSGGQPRKLGTVKPGTIKWAWEPNFSDGGNLNATIPVVIELPAYMVASMKSNTEYREAVRDYLEKSGRSEWAQPRFRRSMAAIVASAKDRFTRGTG